MLKRIFVNLALSALLAIAISPAYAIGKSYTGSWYNPDQNGHGFNFEMLEDGTMLVFWYVYRPDGTSTFLLGVAQEENGTFTATLQITEGMTFGAFDPADNAQTDWGTIKFTFADCNHGTAQWTTSAAGYSNGSTPITRLTSVANANCHDSPFAGNYNLELSSDQDGFGIGRTLLLPDGELIYGLQFENTVEIGRGSWQEINDEQGNFSATGYSSSMQPSPFIGTMDLEPDGISGNTNTGTEFTGIPLPTFQNNLSLSSIAGDYDVLNELDGTAAGQVTVDAQGVVTGSMLGCNIDGTLTVPDSNFNQFTIITDYDSCGTGTLRGAGTMNHGVLGAFLVDEAEGLGYLFNFEPD